MIFDIYKEIKKESITSLHRRKFTHRDWELIINFLTDTTNLDPNDRQTMINRLFLDHPDKPKNWLLILEFLQFINSRDYREKNPENLNARPDDINYYLRPIKA